MPLCGDKSIEGLQVIDSWREPWDIFQNGACLTPYKLRDNVFV